MVVRGTYFVGYRNKFTRCHESLRLRLHQAAPLRFDSFARQHAKRCPIFRSIGCFVSHYAAQHDGVRALGSICREFWFYKDPNQLAYVMNTETEALSMYNNSRLMLLACGWRVLRGRSGRVLQLEGTDDDGEDVDAELTTGFTDLGEQHTKHAGSPVFRYTSDGPITVSVDTYGMRHPTQIKRAG